VKRTYCIPKGAAENHKEMIGDIGADAEMANFGTVRRVEHKLVARIKDMVVDGFAERADRDRVSAGVSAGVEDGSEAIDADIVGMEVGGIGCADDAARMAERMVLGTSIVDEEVAAEGIAIVDGVGSVVEVNGSC